MNLKRLVPEYLCGIGGAAALGGLLIFIYALKMSGEHYEIIFGNHRNRADVGIVGVLATIAGALVLSAGIFLFRSRQTARGIEV